MVYLFLFEHRLQKPTMLSYFGKLKKKFKLRQICDLHISDLGLSATHLKLETTRNVTCSFIFFLCFLLPITKMQNISNLPFNLVKTIYALKLWQLKTYCLLTAQLTHVDDVITNHQDSSLKTSTFGFIKQTKTREKNSLDNPALHCCVPDRIPN